MSEYTCTPIRIGVDMPVGLDDAEMQLLHCLAAFARKDYFPELTAAEKLRAFEFITERLRRQVQA